MNMEEYLRALETCAVVGSLYICVSGRGAACGAISFGKIGPLWRGR